jgi:hypothetical protein
LLPIQSTRGKIPSDPMDCHMKTGKIRSRRSQSVQHAGKSRQQPPISG